MPNTNSTSEKHSGRTDRLFWDGSCGFCCWWVGWAERRGAGRWFEIAAYQDTPDPPMDSAYRARASRSVQVLTARCERLEGGRAVLHVLTRIGWKRRARVLGTPPLLWIVELGYRMISANRASLSRLLYRDPQTCKETGAQSRSFSRPPA